MKFAYIFSFFVLLCFSSCENKQDATDPLKKDSTPLHHLNERDSCQLILDSIKLDPVTDWYFFPGKILEDTIILAREAKDAPYKSPYVLGFRKNGTFNFFSKEFMLLCGNGNLDLDTSSRWSINQKHKTILLTLNGYYSMDFQFKSKKEYRVDSSENGKHILIRTKTIYFKKAGIFEKLP